MHTHPIVAAPAIMLAALNIKASFALARAACYERRQKVLQFILVWTLPIAGGTLVWALAAQSSAEESHGSRQSTTDFYACRNDFVTWTDSSSGGGGGYGSN